MNKTEVNTVSVVHLIWLPFGTAVFNNFISSYCKYSSGYPHELVLLFNGVSREEELEEYLRIVAQRKIPYRKLVHFGSCQDLDAYFWAANQLDSTFLLFLNSYSELLAGNWLEKYMVHAGQENIGLLGATGSWQSYYRTVFINNKWKWEGKRSVGENISKFKLLIKAVLYWRLLFPDFPNPHIRSNAFMLNRKLMLSIKRKPTKKKFAAYRLESGYNGITAQIFDKGLEAVVIDRMGNSYRKNEWLNSKVFWTDQQQNLLISDNQTRAYDDGDKKTRARLFRYAWGDGQKQL